jgi:hypothetical protein
MDFETFLLSLYVVVDESWKRHHPRPSRRVGRPPALTEAEVVTLADGSEVYRVIDSTLIPATVRCPGARAG